jgi:hypothetical protein
MTAARRVSRLPYVLLGAMTFVSFAGPFVILAAVRGGPSKDWPPDRGVEWGTIIVVLGLEIGLFLACVTVGWWQRKLAVNKLAARAEEQEQNWRA